MMEPAALRPSADACAIERIGVARLIRAAFQGNDLAPLRARLQADVDNPGAAMDLAVVEQLLGNLEAGLAIQRQALARRRLYRSPRPEGPARLRVLALAAPLEVGGNAPIEFLISDPDVELATLYVVPGLPIEIPEHDVAIVVMTDGDASAPSLAQLAALAADWPRPLLNRPERIARMDRDRLFTMLQAVPGLDCPVSVRVSRDALAAMVEGTVGLPEGVRLPIVVRPVGSHAGRGLDRLEDAAGIAAYLTAHGDPAFFLMRFVDYAGSDGLFRKYRVVFVDGRPFACHMAIADQWKIWYLNADMFASPAKRAEEARFMQAFDEEFGWRHRRALRAAADRLGLDYFSIDCAETPDGRLLVFEAGVAMIVHDMDPVDLYPYKAPQMRKVFSAFTAMLGRHAAL